MPLIATRSPRTRAIATTLAALAIAVASTAQAAVFNYHADLSGPNESPPVASPGVGTAEVNIDDVAHTMRVRINFTGLLGTTTASHIHGPTTVAGTGTANVMTTTPSFVGFPLGVTFGNCDIMLDLTQATSYRAGFITLSGGTVAGAEAAMLAAIADGKAYLNIHSTFVASGEIRGFLLPFNPTPARTTSWGRVKTLFR